MAKTRKQRQSIPGAQKYTFKDFNTEFPDDDACLEFIKEQRWPDGRTLCEKCGIDRKHYRVTGRTAYACDHCGNHIYPLAETIFHKSTTSLRTWFYAMYLMGSTRCGVSAKQIQRETGVTYKTAWRIFKQIRSLMSEDAANQIEFGPITQAGTVQGIPIKIGGENDPVPVHLEDGSEKSIVLASRSLAKDLAPHLFTSMVRIHGMMRTIRNRMGEWELLAFHARSFELIPEGDIRSNIAELQALPAKWKSRKDPLTELMVIRSGGRPQ